MVSWHFLTNSCLPPQRMEKEARLARPRGRPTIARNSSQTGAFLRCCGNRLIGGADHLLKLEHFAHRTATPSGFGTGHANCAPWRANSAPLCQDNSFGIPYAGARDRPAQSGYMTAGKVALDAPREHYFRQSPKTRARTRWVRN